MTSVTTKPATHPVKPTYPEAFNLIAGLPAEVSPHTISLLHLIWRHTNSDEDNPQCGKAWVSQANVAREMHVGLTTIRASFQDAYDWGFISREHLFRKHGKTITSSVPYRRETCKGLGEYLHSRYWINWDFLREMQVGVSGEDTPEESRVSGNNTPEESSVSAGDTPFQIGVAGADTPVSAGDTPVSGAATKVLNEGVIEGSSPTLVCDSAYTHVRVLDSTCDHEHESPDANSLSHVEFSSDEPAQPFSRGESPFHPSIPTRLDGEDFFVKKDKAGLDSEDEPMDAATQRRIKKEYAIEKDAKWRELSEEVKERVKALILRCKSEWNYRATHDEDNDPVEERTLPLFSVPTAAQKIELARILQTYTEPQVLKAYRYFVNRPRGFDGVDYPWALFLDHEFEILVDDPKEPHDPTENSTECTKGVKSHEPPRTVRNQPSLESVVAALDAKDIGSSWVARCPFRENHAHGDSNPSLVINQNEAGKILVRCRGGCDQRAVWNRVVELASKVAVEDLPEISPKVITKKTFPAPEDFVADRQANLATVPAAQEWLTKWGITRGVVEKLQLGAHLNVRFKRKDGTIFYSPAVYVPHRDLTGKLIGLKMRALAEKGFTQEPGSVISGLFAATYLDPNADEVLVFEGDKDIAIAMSHGFNATGLVSATSKLFDEDIAVLARYKKIYLIGDQDARGVAAMDALSKRLPTAQVLRIPLATKDVGELFQQDPLRFKERLSAILDNGEEICDSKTTAGLVPAMA